MDTSEDEVHLVRYIPSRTAPVTLSTPPTQVTATPISDTDEVSDDTPLLPTTTIEQNLQELKSLQNSLKQLSLQVHVLSQQRVAERAAANKSDDGPAPETCPICFDNFHCPGTCATRCGHVFHTKCLESCLKNSNACPVCRANVYNAELIELMSGFGEKVGGEGEVVDLVGETDVVTGALDDGIINALNKVRETIDSSYALDNMVINARKEKIRNDIDLSSREEILRAKKETWEREFTGKQMDIERRNRRSRRKEEAIEQTREELERTLCDVRKRESSLQIREAEVEAQAEENGREKLQLEKDKMDIRDKERRMKALAEAQRHRKVKEQVDLVCERTATLEQLLRSHGINVPGAKEQEDVSRDAFKVDLDDEIIVVESPIKKRRAGGAKPNTLIFGTDLKKGSAYGRPQPPRKRGIGMQSFAPERRPVTRPGGVAQKRKDVGASKA